MTAELATTRGMRPALYVDIGCDLYSSTVTLTVLTWLFESRLIRKGTILGYDDIRAGGGYIAGEGLAHLQTMENYGVKVREIAPYCCFEVLSYRDMPARGRVIAVCADASEFGTYRGVNAEWEVEKW